MNSVTITKDDVKKCLKKTGEIMLYTGAGVAIGTFVIGKKIKKHTIKKSIFEGISHGIIQEHRNMSFQEGFKAGSGSMIDLMKSGDFKEYPVKDYSDEEIVDLIEDEYINWIENQ